MGLYTCMTKTITFLSFDPRSFPPTCVSVCVCALDMFGGENNHRQQRTCIYRYWYIRNTCSTCGGSGNAMCIGNGLSLIKPYSQNDSKESIYTCTCICVTTLYIHIHVGKYRRPFLLPQAVKAATHIDIPSVNINYTNCTHVHVHIQVYTCTYVHVYTCTGTCIYLHICIYMYMYT